MRTPFAPHAFALTILTGLAFCASMAAQQSAPSALSPVTQAKIAQNYCKLPISFEANHGQSDARVKFLARGSGYGLFLTAREAVLALHAPATRESRAPGKRVGTPQKTDVVHMQLRGANASVNSVGVDLLPGTANYFVGNDPSKWQTNVPTYSKVKFNSVYPGIDLVYYGDQGQLEYDFVVAPNGDPKTIRLHFTGATKLALNEHGDLSVTARHGQIAFHNPVIYQQADGGRRPVQGHFTLLARNEVGFALSQYNHAEPLVIDPVLAYSTYLDGSSALAVDSSGSAYVAGGDSIIKLNPTATALVYSAVLGGAGIDSIAVDVNGNAYVAGGTSSDSFPVTSGAFQTTNNDPYGTAFVTKLDPTGTTLLYSTYLGGSNQVSYFGDDGYTIAVDAAGSAYVGGLTGSVDFPVTPGAFETTFSSQEFCGWGFVTKLDPKGHSLVYSTYLGGGGDGEDPDSVSAIAVDNAGNAYLTGTAYSPEFPTTPGAFQTTQKSSDGAQSAFAAKLNSTGTALLYSTLLGGSGGEQGNGDDGNSIAVDAAGNAYVTGLAYSPDFPTTPGAFQTVNNDGECPNAFITQVSPTGAALIYSTYLGGSGGYYCAGDAGNSIVLDSSGDAYVAGFTASSDFPVTLGAFQTTKYNFFAGFVTKLNATGSALLYSTFLGGSGVGSYEGDFANSIAADGLGNFYVAGVTDSTNFPVTPWALQIKPGPSFLARLELASPAATTSTTTTLLANANPQTFGLPSTFTASVVANGSSQVPDGLMVFYVDGTYAAKVPLTSGTAAYSISALSIGAHFVQAIYDGNSDFAVSNTGLAETIVPAATPTFSPAPGKFIGQVAVNLSDATNGAIIHYTLDRSTPDASSPVYSGPITISDRYTIVTAVAAINGKIASANAQAAYAVIPQTPMPVISPGSGKKPLDQLITITDADPTATIRYTTDGSTPTANSNYYDKPFVLTASEEIKAIAISTGDVNSKVAFAGYTVP